jgi:pyruvate dehydrogenase E2 component (dihydrolipoamide acetyltransferase)
MAQIVMPRLSDSMEEGVILKWMKGVGDEVAVGDELVEIETDKANMAYEADVAGTLTEILAQEGDTLPIGEPIAVVGDPGSAPAGDEEGQGGSAETDEGQAPQAAGPVAAGDPPLPAVAEASSATGPPTAPPAASGVGAPADEYGNEDAPGHAGRSGRVKASPLARRIASELGVDLAGLGGSGPAGRIVKRDVEDASPAAGPAAAAPDPSSAPETAKGRTTVQELTRLQQVVARRMSESKATAPHFYLQTEIDMSAAVAARGRIKAMSGDGEVVPSFNDMVVKACALALRKHPIANGAYKDGRFELYSRVNVGVAVAAQDALVVPTVFDADRKGLREIATDTRALAGKVRDGSITPPELSGGTFTVSNLGMYGVTNFSAVINAPQAAILAVGAITEKPVVRDGEITTAHLLGVTLACDHRILYGAPAAEFLARIRSLLEEPLSLAL